MKQEQHQIKGMQRDLTVSKFSPEYAYENMNIRITARENNTLLSATNEKGTKVIRLALDIDLVCLRVHIEDGKLIVVSDKPVDSNVYYESHAVYQAVGGEPYEATHFGHIQKGDSTSQVTTLGADVIEVIGFYLKDKEPQYDEHYQYYTEYQSPTAIYTDDILKGIPLGECELKNYVVLFNKDVETNTDYIYRLYEKEEVIYIRTLFSGSLDLDIKYPIQALGSYENESIQKVYWVDGINQARVINIAYNSQYDNKNQFNFLRETRHDYLIDINKVYNKGGMFPSGVIQYAFSYFINNAQESTIFYASPLNYISFPDRGGRPDEMCNCAFDINILNPDSSFDGINIYSIIRTSLDAVPTTSLVASIPIVKLERSKVDLSTEFEVISSLESEFITLDNIFITDSALSGIRSIREFSYTVKGDYRVYSPYLGEKGVIFIRESELYNKGTALRSNYKAYFAINIKMDGSGGYIAYYVTNCPTCTFNKYIAMMGNAEAISYTDTGTYNSTIDPTELLYKGGEEIVPYTIAQKDNTLFLGNLSIKRSAIPENIRSLFTEVEVSTISELTSNVNNSQSPVYKYTGFMSNNNSQITTFSTDSYYRLGVILQHKTGKWSEAIPTKDYLMLDRPSYNKDGTYNFPKIKLNLSTAITSSLSDLGYVAAKPVIVFPSITERGTICQGVLLPTVYFQEQRSNNSPYIMSSWFSRAKVLGTTVNRDTPSGSILYWSHNDIISAGPQNRAIEMASWSNCKVDESFFTFHSPEIEFDTSIRALLTNAKLRIVGYAACKGSFIDYSIQGNGKFRTNGTGSIVYSDVVWDFGTPYDQRGFSATRLSSAYLWKDGVVSVYSNSDSTEVDYRESNKLAAVFMLHPWHRERALNNDFRDGSPSSLKKKVMSTLMYTDPIYFPYDSIYDVSNGDTASPGIIQPIVYDSNEVTIVRLHRKENSTDFANVEEYVYQGNADLSAPTSGVSYDIYVNSYINNPSATWQYDNKPAYSSYLGTLPNEAAIDGVVYPKKRIWDAVRIQFKSTPHVISGFNCNTLGQQVILPKVSSVDAPMENSIISPTFKDSVDLMGMGTSLPTSGLEVGKYYFVYDKYSSKDPRPGKMYRYTGEPVSSDVDPLYWKLVTDVTHSTSYVYQAGASVFYRYCLLKENGVYLLTSATTITKFLSRNLTSIVDTTVKENGLFSDIGLYIVGELYNDVNKENIFGGRYESAYASNMWIPAGKTIDITSSGSKELIYSEGDTFFQRYDCLKTYPYSDDAKNSIVEILSFMCQTRVNIDGRYDRNRGQKNNLGMSPSNFNLLNSVYTQKNNFFTYNYISINNSRINQFPTTVTWTKEKINGSLTDEWTNITMASTIDLDGDKGEVTSLQTLNNEIFCFQEQGLSNIVFNPRVQIPVSDGVPIEIANSYKVQGKRYISNIIGCANKWSICQTSNGIYFIDNLTNGLYTFDGQSVSSLSDKLGFRQFMGANNSLEMWNPVDFKNFRTFYDKTNDDIYFINDRYCLTYSELIGQFTSFMSYEKTPSMFNYKGKFYALNKSKLWEINGGDYNMFYGEFKPYYVTIVANQDEPIDKIFNTIEYRADVKRDGVLMPNETFTQLDVWNEYQHGTLELTNKIGHPSPLKRKFRVWRANIPRDNGNRNRIRNTWAYVKLQMNKESTDSMELHDINVGFYE